MREAQGGALRAEGRTKRRRRRGVGLHEEFLLPIVSISGADAGARDKEGTKEIGVDGQQGSTHAHLLHLSQLTTKNP